MLRAEDGEVSLSLGFPRACHVCGDVKTKTIALNRRVWLCVSCGKRVGRAANAGDTRGTDAHDDTNP